MAKIKLLITDLDSSAVTNQTTRSDLLSDKFVSHVSATEYKAYYVCTHRAFCTLPELYGEKQRALYAAKDFTSTFTHVVLSNISKATKLQCIAVSTPDDLAPGMVCGAGYNEFIAPLEKEIIKEISKKVPDYKVATTLHAEAKFVIKCQPVAMFDANTKNAQLLQILADMAKRYPNDEIEVDFLEDMGVIRDSARRIAYTQLPKNVKQLNVFTSDASKLNVPISKVFEIREPTLFEKAKSALFPPPRKQQEKQLNDAKAAIAKWAEQIAAHNAKTVASPAVAASSSSSAPPAPASSACENNVEVSPDGIKLLF